MSALDDLGPAFLDKLKALPGGIWAKIPDVHKALAERAAVRWLALHAREKLAEMLGLDVGSASASAGLLMEAREVEAIFAILEDEVAELVKAALLEYVEKGAVIVGKVAIGLLKGAVPGLSAIPGLS